MAQVNTTLTYETTEEALFAVSNLVIQQQAVMTVQTALLVRLVAKVEGVSTDAVKQLVDEQFVSEIQQATAAFEQAATALRNSLPKTVITPA